MRSAEIERKTIETRITVRLNLDGAGKADISTGIGFFDHMLEQVAKHGSIDLTVRCDGDLHVDAHHSIEDTGLTFGSALKAALGDKRGIRRYGAVYVPMDETLARVVIDLSGRPFLWYETGHLNAQRDYDPFVMREFFRGVIISGALTLHADVIRGEDTHHKLEAVFKAFGRALREAVSIEPGSEEIPSTKGVLY